MMPPDRSIVGCGGSLDLLRRTYVHSGRRPKPGVGNLLSAGACAFTVAGWTCAHATRPNLDRVLLSEVSTPRFPAFTGSGTSLLTSRKGASGICVFVPETAT